jgi:hypothetical protein
MYDSKFGVLASLVDSHAAARYMREPSSVACTLLWQYARSLTLASSPTAVAGDVPVTRLKSQPWAPPVARHWTVGPCYHGPLALRGGFMDGRTSTRGGHVQWAPPHSMSSLNEAQGNLPNFKLAGSVWPPRAARRTPTRQRTADARVCTKVVHWHVVCGTCTDGTACQAAAGGVFEQPRRLDCRHVRCGAPCALSLPSR